MAITACGDGEYQVQFVFRDAGGLRKGGDIRVHGVRAGRIDDVKLIRGDLALVSGHLDGGVAPVGAGARARSRPTGLLGEQYVDLATGDPARPLASGARIGVARTGRAVTLSETLDLLDAPTRARLQILIDEAGTALAGHGTDLTRLLAQLPDTVEQTHAVIDQVRRRRHQLRDLIVRGDRLLTPSAARRDDLGRLVDEAAGALASVAAQRRQLAASVAAAPAALDRLRRTASALRDSARRLAPTARAITAAAPPLRQVLTALPAFREDVSEVLSTVAERSPAIRRFARDALPPLRSLARTGDALAGFATTTKPIVDVLGAGGTTQLFRFVDGFAQTMDVKDSIGSLVRLRPALATTPRPRTPARRSPRRPAHRPKPLTAPAAPAPVRPTPAAPLAPAAIVEQVGDTLDQLLDYLLKP
jgi:phospholipid/cholesterol/gamma-HCH transport system substrate-binding protein